MPSCNGRDMGWNIAQRESAPTSARSFMARERVKSLYAGKQMTAIDIRAQAMIIDAGAPARAEPEWLQANWRRIGAEVKRLQVRIAKATLEGRWGKVKALQHLLTRSYNGKMLAVKRVTENQGKRTPGVDGTTWSTPELKSRAVLSLKQRGYKPRPLRRVYIPKSNGKMRPLGIPICRSYCTSFQKGWGLSDGGPAPPSALFSFLRPIAATTSDESACAGGRSPRASA